MDVNVIVFLIGAIIVAASLIFNVYYNKNYLYDNYINRINEYSKGINMHNTKEHIDLDEVKKEVSLIKKDISLVKKDLSLIVEALNSNIIKASEQSQRDDLVKNDIKGQESFSNILNYNKFVNKNSEIINRHKSNMPVEDIAKELNKSIREVEMVIKLTK